ncbi:MAG: arginine deiminase family protein [Halieaceae bacterium]|jgi:dimethylargininase|nr:arginine deiminase family protein [Halieaceae bacterium]
MSVPTSAPRFRQAITRSPARSIIHGLSSVDLGPPDYERACEQHEAYRAALEFCGVAVLNLPALEDYPDSVFVEDAALCTPQCAIVTRPGASTRRGEAALLEPVLRQFYTRIERIEAPGTLDAGDVMMVGDHYFVGRSARSNDEGIAQLSAILERHGMTASAVPLRSMLHLKTGIAYLEQDRFLLAGEFSSASEFEDRMRIEVSEDEAYAANSIWVNGRVIMPAAYPRTRDRVRALGIEVIEVEVSEFRKVDGGVSCLSLRF